MSSFLNFVSNIFSGDLTQATQSRLIPYYSFCGLLFTLMRDVYA